MQTKAAAQPQRSAEALLRASALPLFEARALLAAALDVSREALVARPQQTVDEPQATAFEALAQRRRHGEPLAYLLGEREFFGRNFAVTPAVLIPRPETELLVEHALALLQDRPAPRVLDLGTGSGCIAISIALGMPAARVTALDCSAEALALAAANAQQLGAELMFLRSDWYASVTGRFDLIVANPPYIAAGDPHLAALAYEPAQALTDGADGLRHLRVIGTQAAAFLHPGAHVLVEHGYDQGAAVRALFAHSGLQDVQTLRDAAAHERACVARAQ